MMRPHTITTPPPTAAAPAPRPRPPEERETARIHLLEFVWTTSMGCQPVLFLVRTYLH